jgi:hypothetical protein
LREDCENASALRRTRTVAAPADDASNWEGLEKSVGGSVTLKIRFTSSLVRGIRFRCGSSKGSAVKADPKVVITAVIVIKNTFKCDFTRCY